MIIRVKQLFRGHRELILGFNTFLPKVSREEMEWKEWKHCVPMGPRFDNRFNPPANTCVLARLQGYEIELARALSDDDEEVSGSVICVCSPCFSL